MRTIGSPGWRRGSVFATTLGSQAVSQMCTGRERAERGSGSRGRTLMTQRKVALSTVISALVVLSASCSDGKTQGPVGKPSPGVSRSADSVRGPIFGPALVDLGGRHLRVRAGCGGDLRAAESSTQVVLSFYPAQMPPGAGSCASAPLAADLHAPLGRRSLIDGSTGKAIPYFALGNLLKPDSRLAVPDGQPTWTVPDSGWNASSVQAAYAAVWYRLAASGSRFLVIEALGGNSLVYFAGWRSQTPPALDPRTTKSHSYLQSMQLRTNSQYPFRRSLEWNQDDVTIALSVEPTSPIPTSALVAVAQTFK